MEHKPRNARQLRNASNRKIHSMLDKGSALIRSALRELDRRDVEGREWAALRLRSLLDSI